MPKHTVRLDKEVTRRRLTQSRSQAESWIRLGSVTVNSVVVKKPGAFVSTVDEISLNTDESYVSRAGLKLASVTELLSLDFGSKTVLDIGSSTGGFTDYALQHGASKVIAVDVGTDQLHSSLRNNPKISLHEKTDIRDCFIHNFPMEDKSTGDKRPDYELTSKGIIISNEFPDIIVIDVSFISLRQILPHVKKYLSDQNTQIVAMLKPQFEASRGEINKGVVKNKSIRRQIIKEFEVWVNNFFIIVSKRDSGIAGTHGNQERFYLLRKR